MNWRNLTMLPASVLAIAVLAGVNSACATENDPGLWVIFSTTDAFRSDDQDSRWHYWFDAQARYFDLGTGINQWLARPAVGYEFDNGAKAWLGYARFRARNRAGRVADENRYWQQADWKAGSWRGGRFSMRVRLEQRSISVGDDIGLVLRFMTKYVRPIGDGGQTLIVALEPFVDLKDTDWGGESGLGQNRLFVGLSWPLGERLTLESGYMNQYISVDSGENRLNHLGVLNFKLKL